MNLIGAILSGLFAGILIPFGRAVGQKWAVFKWSIYWQENWVRVLWGLLCSITAVVATMSLSPEAVRDIPELYHGALFIAAASPVTVLSFLMKKNEPK